MKKSTTTALFPILVALNELQTNWQVDEFLGFTEDQKFLLSLMKSAHTIEFDPEQIKTLVSKDVNAINRFLKENGFDIALTAPIDLGVATIMDLVGQWLEKASETSVQNNGVSYPAAIVKSGISTSVVSLENNQVIKIETNGKLTVFIEPNAKERSGLCLFQHILAQTNVCSFEKSFSEVTIPMISINETPDVSWLVGIKTVGNIDFTISQAVQQNKFTLNCDGVHAQSAVALGLRKCVTICDEIVINQPFNVWISAEDSNGEYFPLFGAYLDTDSWKK